MTSLAMTPFDYQLEDMKFLISSGKAALTHEPGVGKTFGAMLALTYIIEKSGGQALVVMPPILLNTWYEKFHEYFDTDLKIFVYKGSPKERKAIKLENHDVVLVSYDLLQRDYESFRKILWKSVTIDESKYIKVGTVTKSKKTGNMNKFGCVQSLAYRAEYVTIMNGTPLTKSPMDLFHIFQLINPSMYITKKNFLRTHARYAKDDGGFPMIIGWQKLEALQVRLDRVSRRMIKSQVLKDLPPKQLIIKQFDLEPKHSKTLKELIDFGFVELKDSSKEFLFLEGTSLLMQARQAMFDPSILGLPGESAYVEVLQDILEDLGDEQVIIFAHFHGTIDIIRKLLEKMKLSHTELHGRVTAAKRDGAVTAFKQKKVQVLLANALSAGVGLDFQQARNVIFAELDHQVDSFWQGMDRVHRPGQTDDVNVFALVAKNTPAVALMRGIKTNIDYVSAVLTGKEDASVLYNNRITEKEEREWMAL